MYGGDPDDRDKADKGVKGSKLELIEEAERFIGYSGKEKKEYVIDKIGEYAEELGIKADLQFVSEKIEELVKLTKGVNIYERKEKG